MQSYSEASDFASRYEERDQDRGSRAYHGRGGDGYRPCGEFID